MDPILCKIEYTLVDRKTVWHEQTFIRSSHHVILYRHAIATGKNTYRLQDVLDLSYRPFSGGTGLFYLHTIQGVFTFTVVEDPSEFIQLFQQIKLN
ncbi:hypothetical protein AB1K83_03860 [Sporosarcina sp. 179-K 3D1 HS]|uniref:hypothetical protein n=1 Tax=Sporosarcina sp. 179-K 3D1 HS TaxID=3232169 RepID=UPI0039A15AC7